MPAVDPATLQLKQDLIDWHYQVVKLCQKIGIPDVCQTYKEARLENILKGLSGKDLKCKLCHKGYYNTQKLRNHIKGKHLKKDSALLSSVQEILCRFQLLEGAHAVS